MTLLAHHHALLAAAAAFHYAEFGASALLFPAGTPPFRTLVFYLQAPSSQAGGSGYLLDNRPAGSGFLYGSGLGDIDGWVNGAALTTHSSLADFCTDNEVRVVLDCPYNFASPTLLSRYTQDSFLAGAEGQYPVRLRNMAAYARSFTAAEKAATSGDWPSDSLLAAWDFRQMTATTIPDTTGHGYDLAVIGQPGTIH